MNKAFSPVLAVSRNDLMMTGNDQAVDYIKKYQISLRLTSFQPAYSPSPNIHGKSSHCFVFYKSDKCHRCQKEEIVERLCE
jgi:hypothetical protein